MLQNRFQSHTILNWLQLKTSFSANRRASTAQKLEWRKNFPNVQHLVIFICKSVFKSPGCRGVSLFIIFNMSTIPRRVRWQKQIFDGATSHIGSVGFSRGLLRHLLSAQDCHSWPEKCHALCFVLNLSRYTNWFSLGGSLI